MFIVKATGPYTRGNVCVYGGAGGGGERRSVLI